MNPFCDRKTRYADPDHEPAPVPPQTVRCVRNIDHPGTHDGVALDIDGDVVFHHWNDDEGSES